MSEVDIRGIKWQICKKCGKKYLGKMTLSSNTFHHICPECQSEIIKI